MTEKARPAGHGLALGFLVLVSVAVFAGPLQGEFISDDISLISNNTYLRGPDAWKRAVSGDFWSTSTTWAQEHTLPRQMYRPLVSLAYVAEYRLWGRTPLGYHLVNLLLHVACVVLLFRWLARRLRGVVEEPLVPALVGALVFAVHPSRVESVSWISGCTDLWMTLFLLLGLELWDLGETTPTAIGTGLSWSAALLCKEVVIVAPLALFADLWLRAQLRPQSKRLAVVGSILGAAFLLRMAFVPLPRSSLFTFGTADFVLRIIATLGGFIRLALVPWPASIQAGYLPSAIQGGAPSYPTLSIVVGIIALLILGGTFVVARSRPALRPWLADLMWFVVLLVPVLNIVPVSLTYYVSERYLYAPAIGLAALVARASTRALAWAPNRRPLALLAGLTLIAGYAVGSVKHAGHFTSNDALWTYEHARAPNNALALSSLIDTRAAQHRWDEAESLAIDLLNLMPHAEDKADAFGRWLDLELSRGLESDPERVSRVQADYEHLAVGEPLPAPESTLYEQIAENGRAWFRSSRTFRVRRALAAMNALDHDRARALLGALTQDPATREGMTRPLILELIAAGDLDEAQRHLTEAQEQHLPVDAERLTQVIQALRTMRQQPLKADEAIAATAKVFASMGERALARQMVARGLTAAPTSVALLVTLADLEIDASHFGAARKAIEQLQVAHPEAHARWQQALQGIDEAQQSWELAQSGS